MSNQETLKLLDELIAAQREMTAQAAVLTEEQLNTRVQLRDREAPLRNILYMMGTHSREHSVHLQKILAVTGAPGAQPTEAQLILGQASEALGVLMGVFVRMSDADLDREYEGQTPRAILEHMKTTFGYYLRHVKGVAGD